MTVRPTSDVATTGWRTAVGAASPIYAEVDESAYDDADYASAQISGLAPLVLGLGATVAAGTHRIPLRLKCSAGAQDVVVRLLNGSGVEQGASSPQGIDATATTYTFVVTTTGSATRVEIGIDAGGSVTVSWDAVPGASYYRVYYGTSTGLYDQEFGSGINVGNVTTYEVTGLVIGTTYYITVTATDGSGNESDYGNETTKVAA